jgi:hypothetical protein
MKYVKMLGLAGLAALALMAVVGAGTASASQPKAEPEGGTFPVSFTGSGGAGKLETVAEGTKVRTVNCEENTSSGEVNSATTTKNVSVRFKKCTATGPFGIKVTCTGGTGAASGEIVTKTLKGTMFYIKAASSEVGIDLEPESGTQFAEFTCGGVQKISVTGSVVGKLTPVNTLTNKYTLTFSQTAGKQSPEGFLAASGCAFTKDVLSSTGTAVGFGGENFGPLQSGVEGSETLTLSKNLKVASTSCA